MVLFFVGFSLTLSASETKVIHFSPRQGVDMTPIIKRAINQSRKQNLHLIFAPGNYYFKPNFAYAHYEAIINHDNGLKKIIFPIQKREEVTIESEGAEFYFHGRVMPFQFTDCKKVTVEGIRIHWDIPLLFSGEVMAIDAQEGWRDIKPVDDGGQWFVRKGRLYWPNIDGFNFTELGQSLAFTKDTKRPVDMAYGFTSHETKVEKRPGGILRIYEKLAHYPPVGSILNSKGDKEHDRYAPAFRVVHSSNILFKNVVVHHALGMGYLFEFCDHITLDSCSVLLEKDSPNVVSSTADATHFANCKGDILLDHCHFENMLDDGTNVHGTYVSVIKTMKQNKVRVALMHEEQLGGTFAQVGDTLWVIHQPNPDRMKETVVVKKITKVNEKYQDITLDKSLNQLLQPGDLFENKTWNPTFTMSHCVIRDHRARNVIIKTPKRIVIEDNDFSSMMSSILLRGESFYWFESGAVTDVLIRNNHFSHSASCAAPHAILYVTPRLGKEYDAHAIYDRNIRFVDNVIENYQPRIIWAYNVDGLTVKGNKITQTHESESSQGDAPLFELHDCAHVRIEHNTYLGSHTEIIESDATTKKTLLFKNNSINRP